MLFLFQSHSVFSLLNEPARLDALGQNATGVSIGQILESIVKEVEASPMCKQYPGVNWVCICISLGSTTGCIDDLGYRKCRQTIYHSIRRLYPTAAVTTRGEKPARMERTVHDPPPGTLPSLGVTQCMPEQPLENANANETKGSAR